MEKRTLKSIWKELDGKRSGVLRTARLCASLTLPSLMPPEGATEDTVFETPYQSVGARGVNTLASKLMLALLPPNSPFFRLQVDDFTLQDLASADLRAEVEQALNRIERAVMGEIEARAYRVPTYEAFRLLIVTGNALLFIDDNGNMRVFRLDQYVVRRDPMGAVLEILIREEVHPLVLPESTRELIRSQIPDYDRVQTLDKNKEVELFTRVKRSADGKRWEVSQECLSVDLPDSRGTYPLDQCPWIPLRWSSLAGEDYGRGLVEEHLGDLLTLDALTKALTEGAVISSRTIGLVEPNGRTRLKKVVEAQNGDFIEGSAEDITFLQVQKGQDYRVPFEHAMHIEQRLAHSFLMMEAVQRDAERVTAEEIRTMAQELEGTLGGIYSILSQEFQLPLVKRMLAFMTKQGRLPEFPEETVQPAIVTGLEALGRGHDLDKLMTFMHCLEPIKEVAMQYVDASDYITRVGTALGMDTNGLVKTQEQVLQEQQMAQAQQVLAEAAPGVTQEITKGMVTQVNE